MHVGIRILQEKIYHSIVVNFATTEWQFKHKFELS
jgi:hypothetical protein